MSPEEAAEWEEYRRTRSDVARNRLVMRYYRCIEATARDMASKRFPPEELESAAFLGLVRAIKKFDPALGFSFYTLAYRGCRWAVQHHLDTWGRLRIGPAISTMKNSARYGKPAPKYSDKKTFYLGGADWLGAGRSKSMTEAEAERFWAAIDGALEDQLLRIVVRLHWRDELTLREISDRVGYSKEWIRRLLVRALDKIQDAIPGELKELAA